MNLPAPIDTNACPDCGHELDHVSGDPGGEFQPVEVGVTRCTNPDCAYEITAPESKHEALANRADDIYDHWREGRWELLESD